MLFRILFLILFLLGVSIRGYYARKVRATRKRKSWKERLSDTVGAEGRSGAILLFAEGIFLVAALLLYLFLVPSPFWLKLPLPGWLRWIGTAAGAISLPFLLWVHYTLDRHWDVTLSLRKDHTLVTSGPYRRIRHPMYTVHLSYFFAWVLVTANILFLINYLLAILLIAIRIPKEEKMMMEKFGSEYETYMKKTGRLLPRLRRQKSQG